MLVVVFEQFDRSGQGEVRLASGSIHVSASVEDFAGEDINGSVALRAERHLYFIHVLAHENGVLDRSDLERHVHNTFGISRLEIEATELFGREGDEGRVILGEDAHLVVETIARKAQTFNTILIEDIVEDLVLVDTCSEEFGNHLVEFGAIAVEGKIAGVGHETGVEASGSG